MTPEAPDHAPARAPIFGVASWLIPLCVYFVRRPIHESATAEAFAPGASQYAWIPAAAVVFVTMLLVAVFAFGCGLVALLRAERFFLLYLPPCVLGGLVLLYIGFRFVV